ncbi:MAG: Aspartokinase [Bogoriella megaspora]|nr:MAG: Aspartokinase [Bogoriella megaspora]
MAPNPLIDSHTDGIERIIPHTQEMNLPGGRRVVLKFGGTSVGKFPLNIADIVQAALTQSSIAVVCSARSTSTKNEGTTNRLLHAAREAENKSSNRHYVQIVDLIRYDHMKAGKDVIKSLDIADQYAAAVNAECDSLLKILDSAQHLEGVSSGGIISLIEDSIVSEGEKLSCQFMTALLQDRGVEAQYIDLSTVVPITESQALDDQFYNSVSRTIAQKVHECGDKVPVITGFFGVVPGGLLSTIGRGYTDLCAGLAAVGLKAEELQVWKEVDGIFTADPRRVPTARLLPSITPPEAAELTFYGAEVIHNLTMEQVIQARIPIRIKNVMNPRNSGTIISMEDTDEWNPDAPLDGPRLFRTHSKSSTVVTQSRRPKRPTAVTVKRHIVILNVRSNLRLRRHPFLMAVLSVLNEWNIGVAICSNSEIHLTVAFECQLPVIASTGSNAADELRTRDPNFYGALVDLRQYGTVNWAPNRAILSLIGQELNYMTGISGKFFSTLGDNDINIEMISQGGSERNISCVIHERDADRALSVVHTSLFTFLE